MTTSQLGMQPPGAFITHLIKSGFKRYGPPATADEFEIHNLDLTSLNLNVGMLVPCLISKRLSGHPIVRPEHLAEVLPHLDKATKPLRQRKLVLMVGGKLMRLEKQMIDDLRVLGVAIMDRSTIEGVCAAEGRAAKATLLCGPLVEFLGRESLSPYVSGRPAIGGRFFGRSALVKDILAGPGNYTILGNRRIGKTSLMKEINERLKLQNVRTAEVYGATCSSTQEVVYKLLKSLDKFREAQHILDEPQRTNNLASYVHAIPDVENRNVAVFIDEFDRILEFDSKQDYEVLHLLRETFEGHQGCRVFLAGFRKVMELRASINVPIFNFTKPVELPLFKQEETFEMVTRPLHRLGIEVSNTELPAVIYQETGGHPELIQIHCAALVRYFQTHQRIPEGVDFLTEVFNMAEYRQKVLGAFLANTNAHEALLCYLLFVDGQRAEHPAEYEFGPKEVKRVLQSVQIRLGVPQIDEIITNLRFSGLITKVGGVVDKYRFSAPRLVDYCVGLDLDFCIEDSLENVRMGETISSEPTEERLPISPSTS